MSDERTKAAIDLATNTAVMMYRNLPRGQFMNTEAVGPDVFLAKAIDIGSYKYTNIDGNIVSIDTTVNGNLVYVCVRSLMYETIVECSKETMLVKGNFQVYDPSKVFLDNAKSIVRLMISTIGLGKSKDMWERTNTLHAGTLSYTVNDPRVYAVVRDNGLAPISGIRVRNDGTFLAWNSGDNKEYTLDSALRLVDSVEKWIIGSQMRFSLANDILKLRVSRGYGKGYAEFIVHPDDADNVLRHLRKSDKFSSIFRVYGEHDANKSCLNISVYNGQYNGIEI